MDSLGWSHEAWRSLLGLPHGRKLLHELLLAYGAGELGHEGEDLVNSSLVIPLYKDATGSAIRPIAVPTSFCKVCAKVCVATYRAELREAAGPHQHAAMCRNGALLMAQKVQQHLRLADRRTLYLRTDIRNAFNEVDRQATLEALQTSHPVLGLASHSWLHRPTTAAGLRG